MKRAVGFSVLVLVVLLLAGCGGETAVEPTPPVEVTDPQPEQFEPGDLVADETVDEVVAAPIDVAEAPLSTIVFLTGYVSIGSEGTWTEADIGTEVLPNHVVQVGPESSCEIQIGAIATVALEADTEVTIRDLYAETTGTGARLAVGAGSVVSRVARLTGTDEYAVETRTTVAGVRGTLFKTTVQDDGTTTVAVAEGTVNVRATIEEIDDVTPNTTEQREVIRAVRTALDDGATSVQERQEIVLTPAAKSQALDAVASVVTAARSAVTGQQVTDETVEQVRAAAASAKPGEAAVIADESLAELQATRLDPTVLVDPQTESVRRDLVNLTIVSEPPGASIAFNGTVRGTNNVSALLPQGSQVDVEVSLDGYQTKQFSVVLSEPVGRILTVPLDPVPTATLQISVTPSEADIVINSEIVGTGSFEREYETGQTVEVSAIHPDYLTARETVTMTEATHYDISLSLEAKPSEPEEAADETAEEPPEPETATVSVVVEPANARITINGSRAGTGEATAELEVGSRMELVVAADGYVTQSRTLLVGESGNVHRFELEPEIVYAPVRLEVEPSDARIVVDGQTIGNGRFTGEYEVGSRIRFGIEADGYYPDSLTVLVSESRVTPYRLSLEKEPIIREITIVPTPTDAAVDLDGYAQQTGTATYSLTAGETYTVELSADRHRPLTRDLSITETSPDRIELALEAIPYGQLIVTTDPADAQIQIDGRSVGTGSAEAEFEVGTAVTVSVEQTDYEPFTQEIEITQEGARSLDVTLQRMTAAVSVAATPSTAAITIDGEQAGTGRAERDIPIGDRVTVRVDAPGYVAEERSVTVSRRGSDLQFDLAEEIYYGTLRVETTPASASIMIDGDQEGTGSYAGEFEEGAQVRIEVDADGYFPQQRTLTVARGSNPPVRFELEQQPIEREVTFTLTPSDAQLSIDGRTQSSNRATLTEGESYAIRATAPRYEPQEQTISVTAASPSTYVFDLKPVTVLWQTQAANAPLVRSLVEGPDFIAFAAADGTIGAIDNAGRLLWSVATANNPNDNSPPVVDGGTLYFSGLNELVQFNGRTGGIIERINLPGDRNHIYGQSVTPITSGYAFPTLAGIEIVSGGRTTNVSVSGGTTMSAASDGERLYIVNNDGALVIIGIASGAVERQIESSAIQPLAHAPAVSGNRVYFVGRRGTLSCVDRAAGSEAWSVELSDRSIVDPIATSDGVYVFTGDAIHAYSPTGDRLFAAKSGASTPPSVTDGVLAYGEQSGDLVVTEARSGTEIGRIRLPARAVVRPVISGNTILVGLADGSVVAVNRDAVGE